MGTKSQHAPNTILERHEKYRVFHQLADLGWVDFDLGSSFIGPILMGGWVLAEYVVFASVLLPRDGMS